MHNFKSFNHFIYRYYFAIISHLKLRVFTEIKCFTQHFLVILSKNSRLYRIWIQFVKLIRLIKSFQQKLSIFHNFKSFKHLKLRVLHIIFWWSYQKFQILRNSDEMWKTPNVVFISEISVIQVFANANQQFSDTVN